MSNQPSPYRYLRPHPTLPRAVYEHDSPDTDAGDGTLFALAETPEHAQEICTAINTTRHAALLLSVHQTDSVGTAAAANGHHGNGSTPPTASSASKNTRDSTDADQRADQPTEHADEPGGMTKPATTTTKPTTKKNKQTTPTFVSAVDRDLSSATGIPESKVSALRRAETAIGSYSRGSDERYEAVQKYADIASRLYADNHGLADIGAVTERSGQTVRNRLRECGYL